MNTRAQKLSLAGICVFLAAITWMVFGQTLGHDFVNFDDDEYVYENPQVSGGLTSRGMIWAFTHVHSSNWHPVTWLSHMLDCQWYGLKPGAHHFTNVLLHTATVILLFLVLRRMLSFCFDRTPPLPGPLLHKRHGGEGVFARADAPSVPSLREERAGRGPGRGVILWSSAFVAAVFAIHPLRVESVAWISERKDVLSGLFFMLTLWAYGKYAGGNPNPESRNPKEIRNPKPESEPGRSAVSELGLRISFGFRISDFGFLSSRSYWLTLVFFALALMSKPMVVTLPFVLLLLDYWPLSRVPGPASLRSLILEKVPLLILSGAACAATLFAQKQAIAPLPLSMRLANAPVSYVVYLKQMFWPTGLAAYYPHPAGGLALPTIAGAVVVLFAVSIGVFVVRRNQPWLGIGWLWFLGMSVPVIGVLQVGSQAHADRYTYLPQIGLYLALAWTAAAWCAGRRYHRLLLSGLATVVLAALLLAARQQTSHWANSESLWTHALACTTDNFVAHNNLGSARLQRGKIDDAIAHEQSALEIKPDYPDARINLGNAYLQKGKVNEAIVCYNQALQIAPDDPGAHFNLGNALLRKGRVDEAIGHYRNALELKPGYAEAHNHLGNALLQKGSIDEAMVQYQKALEIHPGYTKARNNLGYALLEKGRVDEAIVELQKALDLNPDNPEAHYNLGNAFAQRHSLGQAIAHYRKALQIEPAHVGIRYRLALALLQSGSADQAIAEFQKVLQFEPDHPDAQNDLAWLLATSPEASLRNGNKAVELARRANQLTGGGNPNVLGTLAAAYAEAGQFTDARQSAQKAIALAQAAGRVDLVSDLNRKLKLYEAGLPFHQPDSLNVKR